jgi:hypothetical protein
VQAPDRCFAQAACASDDDRRATCDLHMVPLLATDALKLRE